MAMNARVSGPVSRGRLARRTYGVAAAPVMAQLPLRATGKTVGIQSSSGKAGLSDPQPLGGNSKRALDLVVATLALIAAAPLMLLVALIIKSTTGGPVLFVHQRIGFNGVPFDCYKFRTMVGNAEEVLCEYLARHLQAEREWRENQKLTHDPRVTLFGHLLRKSSIDELPQLFNILRGEMSCVGPRPVVADELPRYGELSCEYLKARPGLTGLWQISGRSSTDYARRVMLDAEYARNWSLRTDLVILAWTTVAVMRFGEAS